jgi:hypothetical protein
MVNRDSINHGTMNCEVVWREVSNYIEGDLDVELRAEMERHFSTCQRCASVLSGMRNVIQLYGDDRMVEMPAGFGRRLEKRLAESVRPQSRWLSWGAWLVPVTAMVLIIGSFWLARSWNANRVETAQARQNRERAARNIPPDLKVVVAADGKLFHVADCSLIQGKQVRSLTAKQALDEGYAPCPHCLRKYIEISTIQRIGAAIFEAERLALIAESPLVADRRAFHLKR